MASMVPTREMLHPIMRTLYDFPANASSTEGAKEVAQLAAWRAVQEFAFEPVMAALTRLQGRNWDPDQPFLVADSVRFDWKTAPIRKYASFEDFYRRELETTWGKWSDLQETWRQRVSGAISDEEVRRRIDASAAEARRRRAKMMREANARDKANLRGPGRPNAMPTPELERARDLVELAERKTVTSAEFDGDSLARPRGNGITYALRRLRTAGEKGDERAAALHVRILNGEISANTGMIEAGFRKKPPSRKRSALDKIKKLLPLLTDADWAELCRLLQEKRAA